MGIETNDQVIRLPEEVRKRTYNFSGVIDTLNTAEIQNQTLFYFSLPDAKEKRTSTMQGILSDMGFRELRLLGAGRLGLVFDTTFDQLLRISFRKPDRSITDNEGVHAIVLQPFEVHTIKELHNAHISILPRVEMHDVSYEDEDTVEHALDYCGTWANDVKKCGNVGFITAKNQPKLKGGGAKLPDNFPEKLPVLIDPDLLDRTYIVGNRELYGAEYQLYFNSEGKSWQSLWNPLMHSKELIGVIPNEELSRLKRQDIAELIRNGAYPQEILKQLMDNGEDIIKQRMKTGDTTPLGKLLQRGQGTSFLPIR